MDKASFLRFRHEVNSMTWNFWGIDNNPESIYELGRILSSRIKQANLSSDKDDPPKGSIYSVFRELLREERPFTKEEIAAKLGRKISSIEPDIRALVYHLGLARIDVSQKGSPVFLTFQARHYAAEISQVLERLHSQRGYRPKVDDIREIEPEITALFQTWPDEPSATGDALKDISAWGAYINALFDMASSIEPSRANLPKRYFERNVTYDGTAKNVAANPATLGYLFKHGVSQPLMALINAYDLADSKNGKSNKVFTLLPKAFEDVKSLFELLEQISAEDPAFFRNLRQPPRYLGSMDRPFAKAFLTNYVTKQVFGGPEGYRNLRVLRDIVGHIRIGMAGLETNMRRLRVYLSDDAIKTFWLIDKHYKLGDRFTLRDYLGWDNRSDQGQAQGKLTELLNAGFLNSRGSGLEASFNFSIEARLVRDRIKMNIDDMPACIGNPGILSFDLIGLAGGFSGVDPERLLDMMLALIREGVWREFYSQALSLARKGINWIFMDTSQLENILDESTPLERRVLLDPNDLEVGFVAHNGIEAQRTDGETDDFREAAGFINEAVSSGMRIGEAEVRHIHSIVSRHLKVRDALGRMRPVQAGIYRDQDASRDMYQYPLAENIPEAMKAAFEIVEGNRFKALHPIEQAAIAFTYFIIYNLSRTAIPGHSRY